jgi:hypothetical protein
LDYFFSGYLKRQLPKAIDVSGILFCFHYQILMMGADTVTETSVTFSKLS